MIFIFCSRLIFFAYRQFNYNYYNLLLPYWEVEKLKIGEFSLTHLLHHFIIDDNNYFQLKGGYPMDVHVIEAALFMVLLISSPFLLYSFAKAGHEEKR